MEPSTRWTLLKLPNEILARIAKLCQNQDVRYEERMDRLYSLEHEDGLRDPWLLCPSSLSAFSQSCKLVRSFCCPLLFARVDTRRAASHTFRRRIALVHSAHIQTVELDHLGSTQSDLVDLIVMASNFPNLRTLKVVGSELDKLASLPDNSGPSKFLEWLSSSDEAAVALRIVLHRVRALQFYNVRCDQISALLALVGPQLDSLTLYKSSAEKQQYDLQLLFDRLRRLNLRHLAVDMHAFLCVKTILNLPIWPLESLTFRTTIELDQDEVDFVSLFAPTLRRLTIVSGEDEEEDLEEPVRILSSPSPFLHYLSIKGTTNAFLLTPPSFTPALRHLSIKSQADMVSEMAKQLEARLTSLPTLRSVELGFTFYDLPYLPYQLSEIIDRAITRIPTVVNRARFNPFMLSSDEVLGQNSVINDPEESASTFIRRRRQLVRQVLEFAVNHEERITKTDDRRGMERLIECLRPLAMLKDFEED